MTVDSGPVVEPAAEASSGMVLLTLGALGAVFGDIGTSPLYALHAVFAAEPHVRPDEAGVYGVISLVFWTITLVVSVKYVTFIMRADNEGEGGIMALTGLVQTAPLRRRRALAGVLVLGMLGAALFYGDGVITPAISVLAAVEGLDVAAPTLSSLVVPVALAILAGLFAVQRYGTGSVGLMFGPIMSVWFGAIALSGLHQVAEHPGILAALSPAYGVRMFVDHPGVTFIALASVVLTITGAEALYADIGHFGRSPIRRAWFALVFPALTLNYMGQGALILEAPEAIRNPFFLLVPQWARVPMVLLATAATVIASQAVISGVFSVTHKAAQLGFLPRLTIRHTSARHAGQVYVPAVNWLLFAVVAALVVGFGSSEDLASAYGIAVTGTMTITTVLFLVVVRALWRRPLWQVIAGALAFLAVDLALFSATLTKVSSGGWLPLAVAAAVFTVLSTWRRGREAVTRNRIEEEGPLRDFVQETRGLDPPVYRAPGTAVFLTDNPDTTPLAARANVEHNHVLHETVVIVSVEMTQSPHVAPGDLLVVDDLGYRDDGITRMTTRFGFRDQPNIPLALLQAARQVERTLDVERASYFLSRITIVPTNSPVMRAWRKKLFIRLARNEADPSRYFRLPEDRTITMGSLIEL
jgi:KUP system potassium uptake protein